MIEKTSIVNAQFKLIIPKEIRNNIDIKEGTVVKWTVEDDDIDTYISRALNRFLLKKCG